MGRLTKSPIEERFQIWSGSGVCRSSQPHRPRLNTLDREQFLSPGVFRQASPGCFLVLDIHDKQNVVAVAFADRTAEDDDPGFG